MRKYKTVAMAMLTMLLWGSLFPVIKLGFAVYKVSSIADILLFAGIRFVICGAVICAIAALNEKKEAYKNTGKCIFPILLSGFFAVVLHYSLSYAGLELSASSKTALIKQVGALFYVCFSFVFMKEDKPTPRKILAAVIGQRFIPAALTVRLTAAQQKKKMTAPAAEAGAEPGKV
jgi:drug/metabolite transporter (DMT)-like permease